MEVRPLLVSADRLLVDHVRGLAGAGGLGIDVLADVDRVHEHWSGREQILIGADLCEALSGLPPRRRVAVLRWQPLEDAPAPASLWQAALELGAEHVVALPEGDRWLADQLTQPTSTPGGGGAVLAVAGACGGAGASTLAVGLAVAAARSDARVLLVDGDFFGGGLDLLLGAEGGKGMRWDDLASVSGRLNADSLVPALPSAAGVALLSASREGAEPPLLSAWHSVLGLGERHFDLTIVDLGRSQLTHPGQWWPDGPGPPLLCVVPSRIRAIAAAAVCLGRWQGFWRSIDVITRQAERGIASSDVARALGVPVRHTLPNDHAVAVAGELGHPANGAFAKACTKLAGEILAS